MRGFLVGVIVVVIVVVVILTAAALLITARTNSDAETPHEPPGSNVSSTGCSYTVPGDTLQDIAITFYGDGRYKSLLLEKNHELGILENSYLASGIWLFVPGAIKHWEKFGRPEGSEYEFCRGRTQ
ncbi:MAG TPA: hypothetical protein VF303_01360 [Candidatus Nanoarchaeia archaeon]